MAAAWRRRHGCGDKATLQQLHRRGGGDVLMAEHNTAAASGLRWASNRRGAEEITTSTAEHRKKLQQAHRSRSSH
jgi:hypothetical protein